MACIISGSTTAATQLLSQNVDTLTIAVECGVRSVDGFRWPKEEVPPLYDVVELPIVDLEKLRNARGEELKELLKDVSKICEEWGFFCLLNHGLSNDMLQSLEEQTERMFFMPGDAKKNVRRPPVCEVGFYSAVDDHGMNSKLCWYESLQLLCDLDCVDTETRKLLPEDDGEQISSTLKEYIALSHDLGLEILHYVITALNVDSSKFLQQCQRSISNSNLRLNHYPICKAHEEIVGLLEVHSDEDVLTILFERDQIGGLQIQKDNSWFAIKPQPNTLVVNLGDIMQVWSNNKYCSLLHRVTARVVLSVGFPQHSSYAQSQIA